MPSTSDPHLILSSITPQKEPMRIYVLCGEEEYYIDKIEKKIVSTYMNESEMDFNYTLLYGMDTTPMDILSAARRVPMMSKYTIVVVKEAQHLNGEDILLNLVQHPVGSNILILSFKGKRPDKRIKFYKELEKVGYFFDSKKVYENQLPTHIFAIALEYGIKFEPRAIEMLIENIGSDINRIDKEIQKIALSKEVGDSGVVSVEVVERVTSFSREYSAFELLRALSIRDSYKAMHIARVMGRNMKKAPIQPIITILFNYFSNLYLAFYTTDRTERGLMNELGLRQAFQTRDYMNGLRYYNAPKVQRIISFIRKSDARSKGLYGGEIEADEILFDLVYFIIH